jgi:beta-lactamase regulating signal transducer with metallopeptidase domain
VEALANWIWQGCAVTLAAAVLMRTWTSLSASTRYRLWWATLIIVVALPVMRLISEGYDPAGSSSGMVLPPAATIHVPLPAAPAWPTALGIVLWGTWAAWSIVSLCRIAAALVSLRRAKRASIAFPEAREARLRHWLSVRDRGRPARLVVSDRVSQAAVLGLKSPEIAVAPHVLQHLDDRELDQILMHEWAHVQRRDDVTRLAQLVTVAVAGLHPAIWWIDRRLSTERETACDDWAINLTGSTKAYAACLAKLASLDAQSRPALLLPAVSSYSLTNRIVRLLDKRRNTATRGTTVVTASAVFVCAFVACAAASVDLVVARPMTFERHDSPPGAGFEPRISPVSTATAARSVGVSTPGQRVGARSTRPQTPPSGRPVISRPTSTVRQPAVPAPSQVAGATPDQASQPIAPNVPDIQPSLEAGLPGATTVSASAALSTAPSQPNPAAQPEKKTTPWGVAADAGVSVGRGSQKAAVTTAGFFTRLSKSIAGAF